MLGSGRIGASLVVALAIAPGSARAGKGSEVFLKGPYLQSVTQHSIIVVWESGSPTAGKVFVDPGGREVDAPTDELHEVTINGLEPGRRYVYRVDSAGESEKGEFATAPGAAAPFSFAVFGDTRSNAAAHERVVERVVPEVPDFVLGTGDMVDEGSADRDWQKFFDVERDLLRDNVLYPSVGNHDRQGRGRTADNYRKYFALPENSPDPERYYAFTYGNARFLVLDSNAYSFALTDQTAWIEEQLQAARLDPTVRHVFVSMHHPPYSVSLHGGQAELREAWTPLFEKYRVDAVFSGHDHVYSRADKNGVRYFVTGGGGAPLYPRKATAAKIDVDNTHYFERVNHFLKVSVVGDYVEVTAVRADGTRIETVTWGKRPAHGVRAIGAPAAPPAPPAAPPAAAVSSPTGDGDLAPGGGRSGLLGLLGLGATVLAGGVLVVTLRR